MLHPKTPAMEGLLHCLLLGLLGLYSLALGLLPDDESYHRDPQHTGGALRAGPGEMWPPEEESPAFWNKKATQALDAAQKLQPIHTAAKNLILFLGDGE